MFNCLHISLAFVFIIFHHRISGYKEHEFVKAIAASPSDHIEHVSKESIKNVHQILSNHCSFQLALSWRKAISLVCIKKERLVKLVTE